MKKLKNLSLIIMFSILLFAVTACGRNENTPVAVTETAAIPTATEQPMAARVNGEGVLLSDYEEELTRYQAAVEQSGGVFDAETGRQAVLDFLVEQTIFVQAAIQNGYVLNEADLQAQLDSYRQARGGQEGLDAYLAENFYSMASFERAVARDMAVIWMRNLLMSQVPAAAEQVHARQILVRTENEATAILRQLEVGTSFKDLAFQYDPLTGGDLGWFPRGYLLQSAVEETAFSLQAGQYSSAIITDYGYHIIEVIETDPQHPLSKDALMMMQAEYLEKWLVEQKEMSAVETYVN